MVVFPLSFSLYYSLWCVYVLFLVLVFFRISSKHTHKIQTSIPHTHTPNIFNKQTIELDLHRSTMPCGLRASYYLASLPNGCLCTVLKIV